MPNLLEMRWPVVLVSLAICLGLLFGGYKLVQHQTVEAPLDVALHAVSGVQTYTWKEGDTRRLTLTLRPGANLGETYAAVTKAVRELQPADQVRIDVTDDRTPELTTLYEQANLAVQEAIQTGRYTDAAGKIGALAKQAGATERFTMDDNRVYLTLEQGGHRLLSVVVRPQPQVTNLQGGTNSNAW